MKTYFYGLDVLRGFGIFTVLILHSAFYYFDGIYEVDFNNPPLVVTVIGLLLMFAGLFAMISGFVHTRSTFRKRDQGIPSGSILKYGIVYGLITLAIAYLYFIFTGPGLIDFSTRSMNNSILMALSLARIPLYGVWQDAQETGDVALYLLLNPLVAKNNPILPFFAFGLMGGWPVPATTETSTSMKTWCTSSSMMSRAGK